MTMKIKNHPYGLVLIFLIFFGVYLVWRFINGAISDVASFKNAVFSPFTTLWNGVKSVSNGAAQSATSNDNPSTLAQPPNYDSFGLGIPFY